MSRGVTGFRPRNFTPASCRVAATPTLHVAQVATWPSLRGTSLGYAGHGLAKFIVDCYSCSMPLFLASGTFRFKWALASRFRGGWRKGGANVRSCTSPRPPTHRIVARKWAILEPSHTTLRSRQPTSFERRPLEAASPRWGPPGTDLCLGCTQTTSRADRRSRRPSHRRKLKPPSHHQRTVAFVVTAPHPHSATN